MSTMKFRLAAKTDMGLVRTNNEDNFQVATDLSSGKMRWVNNEICSLGEKGALLVVADGMGGMNAGEVASELAIETVREYFSSEKLTPEVMKNRFSIEKYMNEVIVAADARIKREAKAHPETRGMGTTIVIGWMLNGMLYVSWCGDSRAYIYNPAVGLHQITKDHSYVQSLVDKGAISKEDAFDYPESNIITRSLSDGTVKAKSESLLKPYELCDNDIVLLCTDGLSGMIRDNEMEDVIRKNERDMNVLADELIHSACQAGGSDNITLCLCQILQGGASCEPEVFDEIESRLGGTHNNESHVAAKKKSKTKMLLCIIAVCLVFAAGGFTTWYFMDRSSAPLNDEGERLLADTVKSEPRPLRDESVKDTSLMDEKEEQKPQLIIKKKKDSEVVPVETKKETTQPEKEKEVDDVINLVGSLYDIQSDDSKESKGAQEPKDISAQKPSNVQQYTVVKGDTYYTLAKKFKTTVKTLEDLNNKKTLKVGEVILVPNKNK